MGECMSICNNNNSKEEDSKTNNNKLPSNKIVDEHGNSINLSENSLRRTKKKKTRMPKEILFNQEEEQKLSVNLQKKDSLIDFEESSDENDKSKNKNNN